MKPPNRKRHRPEEAPARGERGGGARRADGAPWGAGVPAFGSVPEIVSKAVKEWCAASGTDALYIDPGSPWQYGIVENINGRLRDEMLSSEIFAKLDEAKPLVARRRLRYNERRIQRALGSLTPATFAAACLALPSFRLAPLAGAAHRPA